MSGATHAGIVLAGGRGTRLGPGPPKALRPFGKTTLLLRTVQMLGARCERIFVAVPPVFPLPPGPYMRVDDLDVAGGGPFAGLVPALEQASASGVCWSKLHSVSVCGSKMACPTSAEESCVGSSPCR